MSADLPAPAPCSWPPPYYWRDRYAHRGTEAGAGQFNLTDYASGAVTTSTASGQRSAGSTASWWHSSHVTASERTPSDRMFPSVIGGPGGEGIEGCYTTERISPSRTWQAFSQARGPRRGGISSDFRSAIGNCDAVDRGGRHIARSTGVSGALGTAVERQRRQGGLKFIASTRLAACPPAYRPSHLWLMRI